MGLYFYRQKVIKNRKMAANKVLPVDNDDKVGGTNNNPNPANQNIQMQPIYQPVQQTYPQVQQGYPMQPQPYGMAPQQGYPMQPQPYGMAPQQPYQMMPQYPQQQQF